MTKLQKTIAAEIEANGVYLMNTCKIRTAARTARAMQRFGYCYYWTGSNLAIARYGVCAMAAVNFANNRLYIARLDAASKVTNSWHYKYLMSNLFQPEVHSYSRMDIREVRKIEAARKPAEID